MNIRGKTAVPTYLILLSVLSLTCLLGYVASAQISEDAVVKPWSVEITTEDFELQGTDFTFRYDLDTFQYPDMSLTVHNFGATTLSGIVQITLYDSASTVIASGSLATGDVAAGADVAVVVDLTWEPGKTTADFVKVRLAVIPPA